MRISDGVQTCALPIAGQAKEEEGERREQHRIDGEEQPFAVDDLGDAADIAVDRAVEARVEAGLGAFEKGVDAREAALRGVVALLEIGRASWRERVCLYV